MTREAFAKAFQKKLFGMFPHGFQHWYPNFIFHYSHLKNVVSILDSGKLYSRKKALEKSLMQNDNANDEVIDHTEETFTEFVRFYFGAKTPTQYINEGILPQSKVQNNAHCPVPVFLLFDFVTLLSELGTKFSNGNIAVGSTDIYSEIEKLEQLEFKYIYHRSPIMDEEMKRHIINCRHAEVLVQDELNIYDYLKFICVRSEAEKETLLYLINEKSRKKISGKVKVFTKLGLFNNDRLFINKVTLEDEQIAITFANTGHHSFTLRGVAKSLTNSETIDETKTDWVLEKEIYFKIPNMSLENGIEFTLWIDNHLVYQSSLFISSEETV